MTARPKPIFLDRTTPPKIVTLIFLAGLSALAMNIFLPSLPGMAAYFAVPYGVMQQSVALYLALSAALQIIIGPISDRFGRRKVLIGALILFLLATLGTLLAPNATVFLVFRMGQAVIASGMALSRAVVRDMVPDDKAAASMIGYVTMGMSLVPMIGPVIGGVLDDAIGWKANFALLLGLGAVVLALVWADLGETATLRPTSLKDQIRTYPGLMTSPRFWGYTLVAAFSSGCFFAYLGGAPYVGDKVFSLTSTHVGALFALTAVGYAVGNFLAGRFSVRLGMNRMILIGTVVTSLGLALLAVLTLADLSGPVTFYGHTIFMGLGNGICLPNANAGMLSVRPELAGTASGLGGAIQIGGGAALAAIAGVLLHPGATEMPLVLLMLGSSCVSVAATLFVVQRARQIGA